MRFAQHFVGAQLLTATLNNADPLLEAFVFERQGKRELALINKTDATSACTLPPPLLAALTLRLRINEKWKLWFEFESTGSIRSDEGELAENWVTVSGVKG